MKLTPKMDFKLVSAINKTMDRNIFVEQKKISNENTLFNKSNKKCDCPKKNKCPKKKKRNLKKK